MEDNNFTYSSSGFEITFNPKTKKYTAESDHGKVVSWDKEAFEKMVINQLQLRWVRSNALQYNDHAIDSVVNKSLNSNSK